MEFLSLLLNTVVLRPYVFLFLAAFAFAGRRLLGWRRTGVMFLATWLTAFVCEFSSTRIGIPFGEYYYTGSTVGQELYISNVPFMDSLSFAFLLFASYCLALFFLLPARPPVPATPTPTGRIPQLLFDRRIRTSWPVWLLTALLFTCIDIVIDPVALRGDRWFLGRIYGYPAPGVYYGVPVANFVGWTVVGLIALRLYFAFDRRHSAGQDPPERVVTGDLLWGCGLYYGVLGFNLAVTFWIGEAQLGMTGILIYLPITALALLKLLGRLPALAPSRASRPL